MDEKIALFRRLFHGSILDILDDPDFKPSKGTELYKKIDTVMEILLFSEIDVKKESLGYLNILSYSYMFGNVDPGRLCDACSMGHFHIVKWLIEDRDVDPNIFSSLLYACVNGHLDIAEYLIENGADVNQIEEPETLVVDEAYDALKFLLKKGLNLHNNEGNCVKKACRKGDEKALRIMVQHDMSVLRYVMFNYGQI